MDNLDDSENNAKISDSAYSNSCSNSQSRRSHSSKSTHSGSSGSSGYGGKPSTTGSSNKLEQTKKDKDAKKKKPSQDEVKIVEEPVLVENRPPEPIPLFEVPREELPKDVIEATLWPLSLPDKAVDNMDIPLSEIAHFKHEVQITTMQATLSLETSCQAANLDSAGFSCAISMHDGVVMYTTQNLTTNLGFPKDMWLGRSFIDFVHPKDRNTFASQITNGLAVPKIVNGAQSKGQSSGITDCKMACRIRRYRSLAIGYGVTDKPVAYMPFLLKFSFKDIKEDDGMIVYLIIQATPICSAYKTPNESKTDATPFVIRHSAAGLLEYIDFDSLPYLGYLPQDLHNMDALMLYHIDDLPYLQTIYEKIVKEGSVARSMPYRMMAHNGDDIKLESEWSAFINPWSMKLEFVIGKHYVVEGPTTPDVFLSPPLPKQAKVTEEDKLKTQLAETHKKSILAILNDVITKPAEKVKQQISKRCHDIALIMESLLEDQPKPDEELRVEIQEQDLACCERDSVMLGGISPHHEYNDSKSSTGTPLSYNQLNYNENLQRYFDSHLECSFDENNPILAICDTTTPKPSACMMSPMAQHSTGSNDISSTGSSALMCNSLSSPAALVDSQMHRLTESILTKHNNDMERELAKVHREARTSTKAERASDTRQKKKEHLARCNAAYQPTKANLSEAILPHGVKRPLVVDCEVGSKHHCSQTRQLRATDADAPMSPTAADSAAGTQTWQETKDATQANPLNSYSMGMHRIPLMPNIPGAYPIYYAPDSSPRAPQITDTVPTMSQQSMEGRASSSQVAVPMSAMPQYTSDPSSWMYPKQDYASTYVLSQMAYDIQQKRQAFLEQTLAYQSLNPLNLHHNNYLQACKSSLQLSASQPVEPAAWAVGTPAEPLAKPLAATPIVTEPSDTTNTAPNLDSETCHKEAQDEKTTEDKIKCQTLKIPEPPKAKKTEQAKKGEASAQSGHNSDETMDKTDGESSYSSFYSSFFKTESGSATDSNGPKKARIELNKMSAPESPSCVFGPRKVKKAPRRKMDPPWMEQVCVTPELVYKYQIPPKSKEEVLKNDLEKIKNLEQPALVNEQLGQLYLDLQLEGVASRLTLEEGMTSSSSSGEDEKAPRRKREYTKLNMIYEENAPFPPAEPEATSEEFSETKLSEST